MSRRIRKHANPLNLTVDLGRLDRLALFGREAPLEIDLGCAGAGFLFERARNHPERDFVGLEVRRPLVELAARRAEREGVTNLRVFHASSHVNHTLAEPGVIARFFVQFPDPCFKKKHRKRRILQPAAARAMATCLPIGGEVYLQSDVLPLAEEMFEIMSRDGAFESRLGDGLLHPSPLTERTEWERHHEGAGEPIYRMLFVKVREPEGPVPSVELRDTKPPGE